MEDPGRSPIAQTFAGIQPEGMRMSIETTSIGRAAVNMQAMRESEAVPEPGDVVTDFYRLSARINSGEPTDIEIHRVVTWGCGLVAVSSFGIISGRLVFHQAGVDFRDEDKRATTIYDETITKPYDAEALDALVANGQVLYALPEVPEKLNQIQSSLGKLRPIDGLPEQTTELWYQTLRQRNAHNAKLVTQQL
jgi:hypothetical protein